MDAGKGRGGEREGLTAHCTARTKRSGRVVHSNCAPLREVGWGAGRAPRKQAVRGAGRVPGGRARARLTPFGCTVGRGPRKECREADASSARRDEGKGRMGEGEGEGGGSGSDAAPPFERKGGIDLCVCCTPCLQGGGDSLGGLDAPLGTKGGGGGVTARAKRPRDACLCHPSKGRGVATLLTCILPL